MHQAWPLDTKDKAVNRQEFLLLCLKGSDKQNTAQMMMKCCGQNQSRGGRWVMAGWATVLFLTSPELCEDGSVGYKDWPEVPGSL